MRRSILVIGLVGLLGLGCMQLAFSASEENIASFDHAARKVKLVIADEKAPVNWVSILKAIQQMEVLKDERAKELMVGILHREAPLKLVKGAPLPDVMPPLEVLKAAAIDVLVVLNAREYISEIKKVYESTHFDVLKATAKQALADLQN